MLKFLEGRDQPAKQRCSLNLMQKESNSYQYVVKNFISPLHLGTQSQKESDFLLKKLPPIITYNPLTQQAHSIERPEYIIKQKDLYHPKYSLLAKDQGFYKRQGPFVSYLHLINSNKSLIDEVHPKMKSISLPQVKRTSQISQIKSQRPQLSQIKSQRSQKSTIEVPIKRKTEETQDIKIHQKRQYFDQRYQQYEEDEIDKWNAMSELSQFEWNLKKSKGLIV